MNKKFTAVSLFAGGGGMTLGLEKAGFRSAFATDIEESSAATFKHNFPDVPFHLGDIRRLSRERISQLVGSDEVDLVSGGPPCQGFSTIGTKMPPMRETDYSYASARVVEWLSPKCFVLENVNYLRTQYGGRYEAEIIDTFARLGYRVFVQTVNAADYGVPQIRKRVIFFGTRLANDFGWPTPTHGSKENPHVGVWSAISDLHHDDDGKILNNSFLRHSERVIARYRLIPEGGRMPPPSELPPEIRRKILATHISDYTGFAHRLPWFPATSFPHTSACASKPLSSGSRAPPMLSRHFCVLRSRAEQCKLVGNAVPVGLAEQLGLSIQRHLAAGVAPEAASLREPIAPVRQLSLVQNSESNVAARKTSASALNAISFFTGIGGLLLGFRNTGFRMLASYDVKNSVERNLQNNFPGMPHVRSDVGSLTAKTVQKDVASRRVDVVLADHPAKVLGVR